MRVLRVIELRRAMSLRPDGEPPPWKWRKQVPLVRLDFHWGRLPL